MGYSHFTHLNPSNCGQVHALDRLSVAAFARWTGWSTGFVFKLLKGRYLPKYEDGSRTKIDPIEAILHIRNNHRVEVPKGTFPDWVDERNKQRDEVLGDFPFVGLREYAKILAKSCDEKEIQRLYMKLHRRVKSESIPFYTIRKSIFIDPIEVEMVWNEAKRTESMLETYLRNAS